MNWLAYAIAAVVAWSISDVFYKVSSRANDELSHYKLAVWSGLSALVLMGFWYLCAAEVRSVVDLAAEHPFCALVALVYAVLLMVSNIGLRHIYLTVQSPVENAAAGFPPIVFLAWYLVSGRIRSVSEVASWLDFVGSCTIILGLLMLAWFEARTERGHSAFQTSGLGCLALLFPLAMCLGDTLETVTCGILLESVDEDDFIVLNAGAFVLVGAFAWLACLCRGRRPYNPFASGEWPKLCASVAELTAACGYIVALKENPVFVTPVTSCYCAFSVLLSRIFLKERASFRCYFSIAVVIAGIVIMSVSEALR